MHQKQPQSIKNAKSFLQEGGPSKGLHAIYLSPPSLYIYLFYPLLEQFPHVGMNISAE